MDQEVVRKYKGIIVSALKQIEDLTDDTGVLVSCEATKIKHAPDRVKIDDDTMKALISLRKVMGDCIRVILDAQAEYDGLNTEPDDLDAIAQ